MQRGLQVPTAESYTQMAVYGKTQHHSCILQAFLPAAQTTEAVKKHKAAGIVLTRETVINIFE